MSEEYIPDPEYVTAYLEKAKQWEAERKAKWGDGMIKPAPPINPRKDRNRGVR